MEEIALGYTIAKPVETQEQCTAYAAMAEAVNAHNAACAVGDTLWGIEDKADCYEVAEDETVPEPEPGEARQRCPPPPPKSAPPGLPRPDLRP